MPRLALAMAAPCELVAAVGPPAPENAPRALQPEPCPSPCPRCQSAYYLRVNGTKGCMKLWTQLDSKPTSTLQANIATKLPYKPHHKVTNACLDMG